MYPLNKNRGFTLIETLIVLSILFLISSLIYFPYQLNQKDKTIESFLNQFEKDIYMMQQFSTLHQKRLLLYIEPSNSRYFIVDNPLSQPVVDRSYDSAITIELNRFSNPFRFSVNGSPMGPGTFNIHHQSSSYKITFPFGRGRYYVSEI
ncbi:hypothetical protein CEY16_04310 [Halalkalibacillus sediminis]|uniref:Competence protein ComG n=1 Tax=Halalkalibacillus sediminis TaxID=2018042 RepID=A0A2I0QXC2_9BACI|nr:competence type IV pilus minor pilin ComGD [Halalkalibacillus sediminis]PKR78983.1 hypothetical protein CEY16_04310 [Halalkalibacillus sediminis]